MFLVPAAKLLGGVVFGNPLPLPLSDQVFERGEGRGNLPGLGVVIASALCEPSVGARPHTATRRSRDGNGRWPAGSWPGAFLRGLFDLAAAGGLIAAERPPHRLQGVHGRASRFGDGSHCRG